MLISEIYQSNQGEGILTGTPSAFVRVSGCNLRCSFCDTPFASWHPEGENVAVEKIIDSVDALGCQYVVITGGEPMIFKSLPLLCRKLSQEKNLHITIETAGTNYQHLDCQLMSISPKLSNSTPSSQRAGKKWRDRHEATRWQPQTVQRLINDYEYQLKFVVGNMGDLDEIEHYLRFLNGVQHERVLMMPEGISVTALDETAKWLAPWCKQNGYVFCDRMHIRWYGNKRGT